MYIYIYLSYIYVYMYVPISLFVSCGSQSPYLPPASSGGRGTRGRAAADGGGLLGTKGAVCREVARAAARSRSNQPTTDPTRSPRESDRVPPTVPRGLLQLGAAPDATPWEMDLLG